jgi:hypothetical protein
MTSKVTRRARFAGRRSSSKFTEDVRKYAAEQGITEEVAIEEGLKQKATEWSRWEASDIDGSSLRG